MKRNLTLPISTAKELIDFVHAINTLHNKQQRDLVVTLTNDIDLTGVEWMPIGNEDIPFYGTFDGAGHTISGLHIDKQEGVCGTIENLTVTGSITCVEGDDHSAVGGIAGLVVGGHIENCKTDIIIDSNRLSLGMYAGGIVGNVQGHSTVSDCLNRGVMDANEYDFEFLTLGDIVGRWEGESVFLQSGRRDTLSGHRRTASSMTKEER